jgi:hypothetical protein
VSWLSAVPDVLMCAGVFFVPGLLATYLGGLRGITAWATAPLATVAVVAAVAVLGGFFGFRFGVWPVVAGTIVTAGLAAGLALLLRARGVKRPPGDPARYSLAVVVGATAAVLIGGVTFLHGIKRPDGITESYDTVFHYSAIRYIEQTGKASPLTIGTLGQPGTKGAFYPDAWHAMAALLAELTDASIPVAATVTCLVIAVLIWPLGCLLLVRQLFGANGSRAAAAVVVAGMVCSLFGAFPWMLTGAWGVLWPNALGMALAPAGVALGLSITRVSVGDTFGGQRWLFGVAGAWAIGIAHPNSALSVALICLFPFVVAVVPYVAGRYRRHAAGTTLVLLAIAAVLAIGGLVASRLPTIRVVSGYFWPTFDTPAHAVVSALTDSTNGLAPEVLLAAFSIVGAVACFLWRQHRWLVLAEVAIVVLYVGSAAVGTHLARLFTGLWYDDSYRIAATLPIVAIPLTTIGVLAATEWLQQFFRRAASSAAATARPALALGLPLALGAVITVATAAQSLPRNAAIVGRHVNDTELISPAKLQFFQTVARLVPASALVADNPFDGTSFLSVLGGIHVLFPQLNPASNDAQLSYLAGNLVRLGRNSRVCGLVRRYDINYMVIAPDHFPPGNGNPGFYQGIADPARGSGFRLVASAAGGQLRLYKITICQPTPQAKPAVAASQRREL